MKYTIEKKKYEVSTIEKEPEIIDEGSWYVIDYSLYNKEATIEPFVSKLIRVDGSWFMFENENGFVIDINPWKCFRKII